MLQLRHQMKRDLRARQRFQVSDHQRKLGVIVMANKRTSIKPRGIQDSDARKISAAFFKLQINSEKIHNGTPCWEWMGACNAQDYPMLRVGGEHYAHRVFYLYLVGEIPDGYEVDHTCRNRRCCSPFHLEAVPPDVNRQRRDDAFTHCRQGHEFTEENTFLRQKGGGRFHRICRACNRERVQAFNQRNPGYYSKYRKVA